MTSPRTSTAHRAGRWGVLAGSALVLPLFVALSGTAHASSAATLSRGHTSTAIARAGSLPTAVILATAATSPHGPYGTSTVDACSGCHRAHTSQAVDLLTTASPQSTLCFTCHNGTGASLDTKSQYTDSSVGQNDPSDPTVPKYSATFFRHDALQVTSHVLGSNNEFQGLTNRHTECSDCHDPHQASASASSTPASGVAWPLSARLTGTSGVAVVNGAAGSAPTYTFLDGRSATVSFEYQLCLKCHSGFTKLLAKTSGQASWDMVDAGIEFNPANASVHPVEGAGRNTSTAMANSLAGDSRYKLWEFTTTSTVRCTNCHAGAVTMPGTTSHAATNSPAAGADLAPHTSSFRGILIQKYEDRDFVSGSTFNETNFALCFLCHTDTPFTSSDKSATNFSLHQLHTSQIASSDSHIAGTIDTAGAGKGNALCAECHFRPHSTATDAAQNQGLVAFSPNVLANGSPTPTWTSTTRGTGSCTLACHGKDHSNLGYIPTGKP